MHLSGSCKGEALQLVTACGFGKPGACRPQLKCRASMGAVLAYNRQVVNAPAAGKRIRTRRRSGSDARAHSLSGLHRSRESAWTSALAKSLRRALDGGPFIPRRDMDDLALARVSPIAAARAKTSGRRRLGRISID